MRQKVLANSQPEFGMNPLGGGIFKGQIDQQGAAGLNVDQRQLLDHAIFGPQEIGQDQFEALQCLL